MLGVLDGRHSEKPFELNDYLKKMYEADAILLGSSTYFADVTSELKALIDRAGFVALANGGAFSGKIGAAVVAVRRGGATHVFDTINHMFLLSSMVIPGSIYWNPGIGCEKREVLDDEEAMRNMLHLGETRNSRRKRQGSGKQNRSLAQTGGSSLIVATGHEDISGISWPRNRLDVALPDMA